MFTKWQVVTLPCAQGLFLTNYEYHTAFQSCVQTVNLLGTSRHISIYIVHILRTFTKLQIERLSHFIFTLCISMCFYHIKSHHHTAYLPLAKYVPLANHKHHNCTIILGTQCKFIKWQLVTLQFALCTVWVFNKVCVSYLFFILFVECNFAKVQLVTFYMYLVVTLHIYHVLIHCSMYFYQITRILLHCFQM